MLSQARDLRRLCSGGFIFGGADYRNFYGIDCTELLLTPKTNAIVTETSEPLPDQLNSTNSLFGCVSRFV